MFEVGLPALEAFAAVAALDGALPLVAEEPEKATEPKFEGGCYEEKEYPSSVSLSYFVLLVAVLAAVALDVLAALAASSVPESVAVAARYMGMVLTGVGSLAHLYPGRQVSSLVVRNLHLWHCGWHLRARELRLAEHGQSVLGRNAPLKEPRPLSTHFEAVGCILVGAGDLPADLVQQELVSGQNGLYPRSQGYQDHLECTVATSVGQ
jgi:hypothetical protein